MDPITIALLAGTALSTGSTLLGQGQQAALGREQLGLSRDVQGQQALLAQLQTQMAMAPRRDARGNTSFYQPGVGWDTNLSPTTRSIIGSSDEMTRRGLINQLIRGEGERKSSFDRRLTEGQAADPLLRAVMYGYGAPTKEGVAGSNAVANATAATEQGDNIRRGFSSAALRTGEGTVPLASNMSQIDKGATAGLRTALARSDAEADPLFQAQLKQFQEGKLNPYGMLRASSSNSNDLPFQPENLSSGVDAGLLSGAIYGPRSVGGGSEALYRGLVPTMSAYGAQTRPNYGLAAAGMTDMIVELLKQSRGNGIYQVGSKPFDDFLNNTNRDPMYKGGGGF